MNCFFIFITQSFCVVSMDLFSQIDELLECYNVTEEYQEEEDPRNVKVLETEGERTVVGP